MNDWDICLPAGFQASGTTCGIKNSGVPDLALFVSDTPAAAAGVFTANRVVGAPVEVSRSRVPASQVRGVVINSGNANACTGEIGYRNAIEMTEQVADLLSCSAEEVLVCSTGIIGVPLPLPVISAGLPAAVNGLGSSAEALHAAATAMMTTDTFPKLASSEILPDDVVIRVTGAAKGAAMIAPNMATMLAVILTDAALTPGQCDSLLRDAVDQTFNCISVDGHTSTSDTVLLLANGAAERPAHTNDPEALAEAVRVVCERLATDIIRDAEGAEHIITIDVSGFASRDAAFRIAKTVAESTLVKTAVVGNDPNWGRITSAAGYAGVMFDPGFLSLAINGIGVYRDGAPVNYDAAEVSRCMAAERDVRLDLQLAGGPESGAFSVRFWTSDLTQEYVRLNSEFTT